MAAKIIVYGAWEAWGVPDVSPACLKVKTYLRMIGLPYESQRGRPTEGPTQKIPYIDDGSGARVGDSNQILDHLKRLHGDELDEGLTPEQRALAHALRRSVEDGLYWTTLYARWCERDAFAGVVAQVARELPPVIGPLLLRILRGHVKKMVWAQGIGRLSPEAIYAAGKADLSSLEALLGTKPFTLGATPHTVDATVFAHVANALAYPPSPLQEHAKSLPHLTAYVDRMRARYWAEGSAASLGE